MKFLPTTRAEVDFLRWNQPDVILVTSDAYIDSPHVGVSVIGRWLEAHGFKVAIIGQPDVRNETDIARLGEPRLFWGVTGGCIDSMVANHTATKKWRRQDDYTPGGVNTRPNRAVIAYVNLIRRAFKNTAPIVIGGIEASLRRVAHYDYWDNTIRRSILFDAKADALVYGMGERTVLELAQTLNAGEDWRSLRGLCHIASEQPTGRWKELPSYEECTTNKETFWKMFVDFQLFAQSEQFGLFQKHGDRYLIHNPNAAPLSTAELDKVFSLPYCRDAHPFYKTGEIRALETIQQSITTHRGCYGQCSFCAITAHQGRRVHSRGESSVIEEVRRIAALPGFNGIIYDVGGPTANMYGSGCAKSGSMCPNKACLMPQACKNLSLGHKRQMDLLKRIMAVPGVKKVFVSSGIRYDLVLADEEHGKDYISQLVEHHVSGQIKVAPEHYDNDVLVLMNKPSIKPLMRFKTLFESACVAKGKKHFMTYYFMVAHPGCGMDHMHRLKSFLRGGLRASPEQVQIFTPTPSTLSAAMYWCERAPDGRRIFVEKNIFGKERQKSCLRGHR